MHLINTQANAMQNHSKILNQSYQFLLSITALVLLLHATAGYAGNMSYQERKFLAFPYNVYLTEIVDSFLTIELSNGDSVLAEYQHSGEAYEKWNSMIGDGKKLLLQLKYSSKQGISLFDPETNLELKLYGSLGKHHPLDVALEKCIEKNGSTMGRASCINKATRFWKNEIDRLLPSIYFENVEEERNFNIWQEAWENYADSTILFLANKYNPRTYTASIYQHGYEVFHLYKSRAIQLANY